MDANSLVKKPHKKSLFTKHQMEEFVKCSNPITGPSYFLNNYFHIQHPTKGKMLYQPYDFQEELLASYHNYRMSISLLGRQLGKCEIYDTSINVINKDNSLTATKIGELLWKELSMREKVVSTLENWLIKLVK